MNMDTGFEALNIMIVDDNAHMRQLVRTILLSLGINRFCECDNAKGAFSELRSFPADIVIVDWLMAPIDGIELVRKIRTARNSANPFVPIIMMTGHSSLNNVSEARDAGVNEFVAKPISAKSLMLRVIEVIERPRLFVRSENYFGPDRRRNNMPVTHDRRQAGVIASPDNAIGAGEVEFDDDAEDAFDIV
jgi:PleD family two-component response regulator